MVSQYTSSVKYANRAISIDSLRCNSLNSYKQWSPGLVKNQNRQLTYLIRMEQAIVFGTSKAADDSKTIQINESHTQLLTRAGAEQLNSEVMTRRLTVARDDDQGSRRRPQVSILRCV